MLRSRWRVGPAGATGGAGAGAEAAPCDPPGLDHVVARDATAFAGAADLRGIETLLGDHPAHERRGDEPPRRSIAAGSATAGASAAAGAAARRGAGRRGCGRGGAGAVPAAAGAGRGGGGRRGLGAAGAGGGGGAPAASEITASRAPTSTVSPSATRISETTPAAGAGTSESTLSVDTSNNGSSAATLFADLLEPARDRAFGDGLTELRHRDVHGAFLPAPMRLAVEAAAGQRERRLAEQLRERRVRVDQQTDVARVSLPS